MLLLCNLMLVYLAILKLWTNKKLSHLLAHKVSLPGYWVFIEQQFTNGKKSLKVVFIN